jgi:YidC/Oxa1 family membrane protein insertase
MEDQGKRLLLTVGLVAVLYFAWTQFFMPKPAPPPPAPPQTATAPTAPADPASAPTATPGAPATVEGAAPAVACDPTKETGAPVWETADYVATFSTCGGALQSFVLKGSQFHVAPHGAPQSEARQIDLVHDTANPATFPLLVQVDTLPAGSVNADDRRQPTIPARSEWSIVSATDAEIAFRWTSPDAGLQVTKTVKRVPGTRYALRLEWEVKNVSAKPGDKRVVSTSLQLFGFQDPNAPERGMFTYAEPRWGTACYIDGSLKADTAKDLHSEARAGTGDVRWTGIDHQYFLLAAAPLDKETSLSCARTALPGAGVLEAQLRFDVPTTLEANQSLHQSVVVYAGPKLVDDLDGVSKAVGTETKLGDAIDFGWLAVLARPLAFLLKTFHGWFGNWGLAIIFLTIIVKLATLYWTTKSMRSMKAMSHLKPEMDKVREKYPNDKTKQNEEMLKLYKTHKISPLGGCLPMLLQLPVWFALYRTLSVSAELFHAPFAYLNDLTAPDPYYVLPVVMVLLMIVQTRVSPTAADSQQQKIMQWTMPAVLGVMSLIFAAGLAVYMLTNSVLGIAHQVYMNRTDPKRNAAAKAVVSTPALPAKGQPQLSKGSKNKKNGSKS